MDNPDSLIENFAKAVYGRREDIQAQVAQQAGHIAPGIREALENGDISDKATNAASMYTWLMDEFDAEETALKLHALTREEIDGVVEKFLSHRPRREELLENARSIKSTVLAMAEEDHIALAEAIDSVFPPGLQEAERAARGGATVAEAERQARALAKDLPDAAVAAALTQQQDRLNRERITDELHGFLQQITPDQLQRLHDSLKGNLEGAQVGLLIKRGWVAALEVLAAAAAGNCLKPAQPKKVKAFGRTLNEVLTTFEDALADADIAPPAILRELLSQMDTARVLRAAKVIADADAAQNGVRTNVTVGRPIRFKTPKP